MLERLIIILFLTNLSFNSSPVYADKTSHNPKSQHSPAILAIANHQFEPPFLVAKQSTQVMIGLELADPLLSFAGNTLILEQQKQLPNGGMSFVTIGLMRLQSENTSYYTGQAEFKEPISGMVFIRVRGLEKKHRRMAVSEMFTLPVQQACGPTGKILPITIFEATTNPHQLRAVDFDTDKAGNAVLRVINGARIGATMDERVANAIALINDKTVRRISKSENVTESTINLYQGNNQLGIDRVIAHPGKRLAVEINACADNLELTSIADTLKVGETVPLEAKVTSLGMPVENAYIKFELIGLGETQTITAPTSASGSAAATFTIKSAGSGSLRATLIGSRPLLVKESPVTAVAQPAIFLGPGRTELTLELQQSAHIPFLLYYVADESSPKQIHFEQSIEPAIQGLALSTNPIPAEGFVVTGPNIFTVDDTVQGLLPGHYTITARATIQETGESTSSAVNVTVVDPNAPEPIILGRPSANPPAVSPNQSAKITFMSLIGGTSTPPASLPLDQVDAAGKVLNAGIATLKDDGQGSDHTAGDSVYTGQLELLNPESGERYYRVRADYFGEVLISPPLTFGVTPFNFNPRPSDTATLIEDPKTGAPIFAREIVMEVLANVSPERVNQIASAVNGRVVGVIPSLHTYLLEFTNVSELTGLQNTIATLLTFNEVKSASVNEQPATLGLPNDPGLTLACPNQPSSAPNQWYLNKIGAPQAWEIASNGDQTHAVAIVDYGINCNHEDLGLPSNGQCALDDIAKNEHATQLAGIIAAKANNNLGIAGAAAGTKVYDYAISSSFSLAQGIATASAQPNVRVINVSQGVQSIPSGLETAIDQAILSSRLVVVASGNPSQASFPTCEQPNVYPAMWANKAGLITVGATADNDQLATGFDAFGTPNHCSNRTNVELYAPGKAICTTSYSSATPTANALYGLVSGSSFATALTSGAAAVLWAAQPTLTPQTLETRLKNKANQNVSLGTNFGSGKRLNLLASVVTKQVTASFSFDGGDFRSTFGYYFKDATNNPKEAHILLDSADNQNGVLTGLQKNLYLSDAQLASLEFFIIPDGGSTNSAFLTNNQPTAERHFAVFLDTDNRWRVKDIATGYVLRGMHSGLQTSDAFFSEATLNPGNASHMRMLPPGLAPTACSSSPETSNRMDFIACWEDLDLALSDRDFNDIVFSIVATDQ